MKIAYVDIYGEYYANDRIFDETRAAIGENLLQPIIQLKRKLEEKGHDFHTVDMYDDISKIDRIIFQDIPPSIRAARSYFDFLKILAIRLMGKRDYLYQAVSHLKKEQRILSIMEPPVVSQRSYDIRFHQYFGRIAAWDTDLVEKYGYIQNYYPQPKPDKEYGFEFDKKKFCTMICGNKNSKGKNELYSERRRFIDFFENNKEEFDLYGVGWEKGHLKNYKGRTDHKLQTLSEYRYCICYENMSNIRGYITEKIFDCFFAKVVPVYWGASDVADYIPKECFVDRRQFQTEEDVCSFLKNITKAEYKGYLDASAEFLEADVFKRCFSVKAYVDRMCHLILGEQ